MGNDLVNAGKISVLKEISSVSIDNTNEVVSGKGIRTGNIKNSGTLLTAEKLNVSGNVDNSGTLEAQEIKVKGSTFSNKGNISSDNISVEVRDTRNDGRILSSNDIDLNTGTLTNTKELLAVKDIKLDNAKLINTGEIASNNRISMNNTETKNSGKILSNSEVSLNNSDISNRGEILSGRIEMQNSTNYDNTGSIKGNDVTLTTTKDINLIGNLHGEDSLTIKGNNISNNGMTTGKGLMDISSNDFTNNKELSSKNLIINAAGNILNNNILGGENVTLKSKNFDNRDMVAASNDLNMETSGNIVNGKGNVIYSGNSGKLKGADILNLEGEILGGNLELNGKTVVNEVGLIQAEKNLKIETPVFKNIGRVTDLDKYETYYETWDGRELSEEEATKKWVIHYEPRSWKGKDAIRYQEQWFDELAMYSGAQTGYDSYIFSKSINSVKRFLGLEGDYFVFTNTAEIPVKALEGRIRSKAVTEYGRVIAGQNISIDTSETMNRDGIISAGNVVSIKADRIDHSSTLGNGVQLKDGREKVYIHYKNSSTDSTNAYLERELVPGGTGYITGSPSVIEGKAVQVDSTKILPQSIPEAGGVLRQTPSGGRMS